MSSVLPLLGENARNQVQLLLKRAKCYGVLLRTESESISVAFRLSRYLTTDTVREDNHRSKHRPHKK